MIDKTVVGIKKYWMAHHRVKCKICGLISLTVDYSFLTITTLVVELGLGSCVSHFQVDEAYGAHCGICTGVQVYH